MVRVNLIDPRKLADQHLIAEYNEILMLLGHLGKHGVKIENVPKGYCLGKGHITFFKNKLRYLKDRHEKLKVEMGKRGFRNEKSINLRKYDKKLTGDWKPRAEDINTIKGRLVQKINLKPNYYRYYKEYRDNLFFIRLLN